MPSVTAYTVCACSAWSTNGYASRAATSSEIETTCRPFIWPGSHLVHRALAEESVRSEDEHQDQDREDDGVGPPRGDVLVAPRRQEPDDQAAEGGSRPVAPRTTGRCCSTSPG